MFRPALHCFIVSLRLLFSSWAFLFLQLLFFHFDYFCFFVNLHCSDQSNLRGNVTICLFRFIHSISVMFLFFRRLDPSWLFCLMLLWNCVSDHLVDIPGMVLQTVQIKLHFTLFPEGAQRIYNEICSLDVVCSPLGSFQRGLNLL